MRSVSLLFVTSLFLDERKVHLEKAYYSLCEDIQNTVPICVYLISAGEMTSHEMDRVTRLFIIFYRISNKNVTSRNNCSITNSQQITKQGVCKSF